MNPLRSISMLPKVGESQGKTPKWFEDRFEGNDKHIRNYRAYDYREDSLSNDISWITHVPDEQLYIEVSYKDTSNQYVSRKFDFGNFLRYVGHCLSVLDKGINDIYLTEARADELYLPIGGGTLTGPLTIQYTNKSSPALKINSTDAVGAKCGIVLYGDLEVENEGSKTTITYNTVDTKNLTCETLLATGTATINDSATVGTNFTTTNIMTHTVAIDENGSYDFCNMIRRVGDTVHVDYPLYTQGITNTGDINNSSGKLTTHELDVDTTVTLKENLNVKEGTISVKDLTQINGGTTSLKNTTVAGTLGVTGALTAASVTASGTVTGHDIIGSSSVKVNNNVKMETTGLTCTVGISELTARYACWA